MKLQQIQKSPTNNDTLCGNDLMHNVAEYSRLFIYSLLMVKMAVLTANFILSGTETP